MTRFAFDTRAAIPAAWKMLWANNLKNRYNDYRGASYHLTASDVENQVRKFAAATARGEATATGEPTAKGKGWAGAPIAWGRGHHSIRMSGDLKGAVRDWLLHEVRCGRLASHNFGRGHISGMRFRPVGEPIAPAEEKTIKAKAARADKPKPVHFSQKGIGGRAACIKPRPFSFHRSRTFVTKFPDHVTCPRCLNILAKAKEMEPA